MESISAPIIDVCANCRKEEGGEITLKVCTACKLVKYCDRDCQAAHRPKHKKACKQRAAKLHDEALFKEHPPPEVSNMHVTFTNKSYIPIMLRKAHM